MIMKTILYIILIYLLSLFVIKYLNRYYKSISGDYYDIDEDYILTLGLIPVFNVVSIIAFMLFIIIEMSDRDNVKKQRNKIRDNFIKWLK